MMAAKDMVGVTAPLGFFDPLGLSKGKDEKTLTKYREAELKHGRVAMLAVLGWVSQERWHPIYGDKVSENPLKAAFEAPQVGMLHIFLFCGFLEFVFGSVAKSQANYKAGDYYGFGALFSDDKDPRWVDFQNRELNNGRLAMFASIGEIYHAYVSGEGAIAMQGHLLPGSIPGI
jgi:hypothetical protein